MGVSLAVVTILLRKFSFETLIACSDSRIGPQQVTELQSPNPLLAVEGDKVKMMSPSAEGVPHEPASVRQRSVELGGSLVAVRTQRLQQGIGLTNGAHSSKDVDNWLGGEFWNCGAPDMFDCGEITRQEIQEAIPLPYELCRPSRIVRHNADIFGDGAC